MMLWVIIIALSGILPGAILLYKNPKKIRACGDDKIAVLDDSAIVFYDYYGNGLSKIALREHISDFVCTSRFIFMNNEQDIYLISQEDVTTPPHKADITGIGENIVSVQINDNSIYILTPTKILVFHISFR